MEAEKKDAAFHRHVEYVVVNESLLGYRTPGAQMVQALSAPGRDPRNVQYPVQLTVDTVRPATTADFAQYRVVVDGYEAGLSKPLIPVLEHHLTKNEPLDRLDPEKVARELRERTLEYAWATRQTPEALLRMSDSLTSFGTTDPIVREMLKRIDASPYTLAYLLGQWRMTDDNGWTGGTVEELYARGSAQEEFADEIDAILNARIQQNELAMAEKGWGADTLHGDLTSKPFVGSVIHLEPDLNAMGYMLGLTYQIIQDGKLEQSIRDYLDVSSAQLADNLHSVANEANMDAALRVAAANSGDPYPDEPETVDALRVEDALPNEAAAQDSQESDGEDMLFRNED